jgi:phospholipid/cholesterol/gamma-HCH transport system substrate-binding protein
MRREGTLTQRIGLGLAAMVLAASIGTLGIEAALGAYASVYRLKATFPRSGQGLDSFSTVKVRGVSVGSVVSIKLLTDGQAEVTLHIHDDIRIPDTVAASAEPLSVFGPKYIKLEPGQHELTGPYLKDGDRITNTMPPTEITDLISDASKLLAAIDPSELHNVVHTLGQGLDGLGAELDRTVDNASTLTQLLSRRSADIRQLLGDLGALSSALGTKGGAIASTARDLNQILPDIGSHGDGLAALLDATSRLSGDLADVINAHGNDLTNLIGGLAPTVQALYDQLACIPGFLDVDTGLIGLVGNQLLSYPLPDGHWVGVVTGPFAVAALLTPPNQVFEVPVARCGAAP